MAELSEHTDRAAVPALLAPLLAGRDVGLLSEAGVPAVADPGALLVDAAHARGIRVVPLVGPSSIVLALMASGLEGQRFRFLGYLPTEPAARRTRLLEAERDSARARETQIFIETPYRNDALLADLLQPAAPPRAWPSPPTSPARANGSAPTRSRAGSRIPRPPSASDPPSS